MIVIKVVLAYNVESIAFCCVVTRFPRFDQRKAAKMTLDTVICSLTVSFPYI